MYPWGAALTTLWATALVVVLLSAGALAVDRGLWRCTRRPGYADHVRRASGFLPLPPRKPLG